MFQAQVAEFIPAPAAPPMRERSAAPGLPMSFVRSSIFGVSDRSPGLVNHELYSEGDTKLLYAGPRLNQSHALLWQAIVEAWLGQGNSGERGFVEVTSADLLRRIGWSDTSTNARRWLWKHITEMQGARLELRTKRHRYSGTLVTDVFRDELQESGPLRIALNPRAIDLLRDEVVLTNLPRKLELGRNQLALWLHDYLSSQSNDRFIPVPIQKLHQLCASTLTMPKFRQRLRTAAELLTKTKSPLLTTFRIDNQDRFVFSKTKTRVLLLPVAAASAQTMHSKQATAIDQARARRAKVAL